MRPSSLRLANAALVLDLLADGAPSSRTELADRTSLSPQALGSILAELVASELVLEGVRDTSTVGRPPTEYKLNPVGSFTVSVLVRVADYFVLIDDALGARRAVERRRYHPEFAPEPLIEAVCATLVETAASLELELDRLASIEFATLGTIAEDRQHVINTSAWRATNVDVVALLEAALGRDLCATVATNDQAQALHALTQIAPAENELVAIIHLGVETRLLLAQGGQLITNRPGNAGLLTHMPLAGNDRRCECGDVGCLTTVSGAEAMLRCYHDRTGVRLEAAGDLIDRVGAGDTDAIEAIRQSSDWLGRGLAPVLGLFQPDRMVFTGGGVGRPDSPGVKRLIDALRVRLDSELAQRPIVVVAPAFAAPIRSVASDIA